MNTPEGCTQRTNFEGSLNFTALPAYQVSIQLLSTLNISLRAKCCQTYTWEFTSHFTVAETKLLSMSVLSIIHASAIKLECS